ncbi:MAG: DUF2589 domain-containing protein [Thermoflexaceae bacterium]|nr:DUF2589 domain-containing protein [Thermoflexaceae bacterium]
MYNPGEELSSIDFGSIIGGSLNAVIKAQSESAHTTVDFVKSVGFKPGTIDVETGEENGVGDPVCVSFSYDKEVSPGSTQTVRNVTIEVENGGEGYDENTPIRFSILNNELEGVSYKIEGGKITETVLTKIPTGDFVVNGVTVKAIQQGSTAEDGSAGSDNASATLKLHVEETQKVIPALYQKMNIEVPILTMMPIPFVKIEHADIDFNVKINSVSTTNTSSSSNSKVTNNTNASAKAFFGKFKASTSLSASFSNQKSSSSSEEVKKDYSLNISIHAVQDDMPAGMSRILDILEESIITKSVSEPKARLE